MGTARLPVVSAEEMRRLEEAAAAAGVSTDLLMENAGREVAARIRDFYLGDVAGREIVVLVGPGNNGGDALVAARHLADWGARLHIVAWNRRPGDPKLRLCQERQIPILVRMEGEALGEAAEWVAAADLILDGLLGTGRSRPITGTLKALLEAVRGLPRRPRPRPWVWPEPAGSLTGRPIVAARRPTLVALDLPTGLDADTGIPDPAAFPADVTVTLGFPKLGLFNPRAADFTGELLVADIGFPPGARPAEPVAVLTPRAAADLLPARPDSGHKGTFGRVLMVVGSRRYIGAARLAAAAAYRVGAGLVTLAVPAEIRAAIAAGLPEAVYLPYDPADPAAPGLVAGAVPEADAVLVGCGLGQEPYAGELVEAVLGRARPGRLVVDADGLNWLARRPELASKLPEGAVLTPHPGEFARLLGEAVPADQPGRLRAVADFAARVRGVVVLKGAYTLIGRPDGSVVISPFANAALASAGTGDVLAGLIAGLMAQGMEAGAAAEAGVWLHAAAAEEFRRRHGRAGLLASDLLEPIPRLLGRLRLEAAEFC